MTHKYRWKCPMCGHKASSDTQRGIKIAEKRHMKYSHDISTENMKTVQIRLTSQQLQKVDELVEQGIFPSRSEAVRDMVRAELNSYEKVKK